MPPKEKKEKEAVPRRVYKKKESKVDKMEQVEEEKQEEKEEEKQEEKRVDVPQLPNQIRQFDRVPEQRIGENTELFNRSILAKTLSLPMSRGGGNFY